MFSSPQLRVTPLTILFTCLILFTPATETQAQRRRNFDTVEIKTHNVAGNVYMLEGTGGNIGVSIGEDGVFLIDDQFAPLTKKIVSAIRKLSDKEIRFLVNTHIHPDHTGGNENFGRMGTLIFAHDSVRAWLKGGTIDRRTGKRGPGKPRKSLPLITFNDTVTFHLNGEEVHVFKAPNAHTDGDSIVHFKGSNVIHMGDVFRTTNYPYIDKNHGGTFKGMVEAMNIAVELADPNTRVIPGHGVVSDQKGMMEFRDMLVAIGTNIQDLINNRKSLEETLGAKPTAKYDARWGKTRFFTKERLVTLIYNELKGN